MKIKDRIYYCFDCSKIINRLNARKNEIDGKVSRCMACAMKLESTTHGESKTRLYIIWKGMKGRCYDESNASYRFYGALGISVCKEWKLDFTIFKEWAINNGYSEELTIDRIESSKDYYPENCRWATKEVQYCNRKTMSTNTSGYRGVGQEKGKSGWYARIALSGNRIRLGRFPSAEEAALAYNNYVIANNLPHNLNIL